MRLWTIQGIEIYEQLQRDEVAYCTEPAWADDEKFLKAYGWMAEQMRQRIGEPPIKDIKYPMWAWYQYTSAKSKKPSRSYLDIEEGISVYMEIEIPDNEVLLSDFSNWHNVLNQWPQTNWKRIEKKTDLLEKETAKKEKTDSAIINAASTSSLYNMASWYGAAGGSSDDDDFDEAEYRAYREELAAYDDFVASLDMDD